MPETYQNGNGRETSSQPPDVCSNLRYWVSYSGDVCFATNIRRLRILRWRVPFHAVLGWQHFRSWNPSHGAYVVCGRSTKVSYATLFTHSTASLIFILSRRSPVSVHDGVAKKMVMSIILGPWSKSSYCISWPSSAMFVYFCQTLLHCRQSWFSHLIGDLVVPVFDLAKSRDKISDITASY